MPRIGERYPERVDLHSQFFARGHHRSWPEIGAGDEARVLQETLVSGHYDGEQLECRAVSLDTKNDTPCIEGTRVALWETHHAHVEPGHATFVTQQAGRFTPR